MKIIPKTLKNWNKLFFSTAYLLISFQSVTFAQEKFPLDYREISSYNCRRAIEDAKQAIQKYDVKFWVQRWKISDFYKDGPDGKIIVFVLSGKATDSILKSEQLMLNLSKNIINNCSEYKVYKVDFGIDQTGNSEAFGLLNGEVRHFETLTPPDCNGKWGTNCVT